MSKKEDYKTCDRCWKKVRKGEYSWIGKNLFCSKCATLVRVFDEGAWYSPRNK